MIQGLPMKLFLTCAFLFFTWSSDIVLAQDETATLPLADESAAAAENPATVPATEESPSTETSAPDVAGQAKELAAQTEAKVNDIAGSIDRNESAKQAAEGLLGPIYTLAEKLSFSSFHWLAFGLMCAGVVSFALQLVLGKLVVLLKGSINIREILSDAIGLIISLVGLVLTTQAAAENSSFTHSPAAVLSSAVLGAIGGIVLYRWGQAQEVNAVTGQRAAVPSQKL